MNNKRKQLIVKIVAHLVLLLGAITMLVPFIWMLSSSVKSLGEVFVFPPTLFGEKIVWENYTKISSRFDYLAYFLNSVKVSAWVVIFQVFTSATAGYVFAKLNFRGRDKVFTVRNPLNFIEEKVHSFIWLDMLFDVFVERIASQVLKIM